MRRTGHVQRLLRNEGQGHLGISAKMPMAFFEHVAPQALAVAFTPSSGDLGGQIRLTPMINQASQKGGLLPGCFRKAASRNRTFATMATHGVFAQILVIEINSTRRLRRKKKATPLIYALRAIPRHPNR